MGNQSGSNIKDHDLIMFSNHHPTNMVISEKQINHKIISIKPYSLTNRTLFPLLLDGCHHKAWLKPKPINTKDPSLGPRDVTSGHMGTQLTNLNETTS